MGPNVEHREPVKYEMAMPQRMLKEEGGPVEVVYLPPGSWCGCTRR